jgi:DNA-binding response OmpR family regulator
MARVLIIEDERKVLRSLAEGLRTEGYEVATAATGEAGYQLALTQHFDCVVLDLMLPGRPGLQVLAELRKAGKSVPVLILTARDSIEDRVTGLDAGAEDYLVKPFALAELLARLRVLLRPEPGGRETVLRADDLEMDLLHRRVTRGGVELTLTHREFEVLEFFLRHKNTTITREMLGRDVWKDPSYELTNVIEVYITFLRRKVERPGQKALIHTIRGIGYILRDGDEGASEPCA